MAMQNIGYKKENLWCYCAHSHKCGHKINFLESLRSEGIWLPRVSFRKQVKSFWLFSRGYGTESCKELLGVSYQDSALKLFEAYLDIVAPHQERANALHKIGGAKLHCEADEVAFRYRAVVMEDGETKIEWMRYIGVLRRGSAKIYLHELPLRYTGGAGQGGGGAISVDELDDVFRVDTDDPLIAAESVLHTDSAKSYKRLGIIRWPGHGALHDPANFEERYKRH